MSYAEGVQSCVNHDLVNHDTNNQSDDEMIVIVNICDGAVHPVTICCDRTMLTQSISIIKSNTIRNNNRNLAKPTDLLSTMSSNGKENFETLDKIFKDCFMEKHLLID